MQYQNPILKGFYPDPSICRAGDYFYLANSTFEYFPAVPVFKSKNLVNWEQVGSCVTEEHTLKLDNCGNSKGVMAPDISYHDGVFYMVTYDHHLGHFYVTTTDPAQGWSDPIRVKLKGGIDPSFFFEGDKTYFLATQMIEGKHSTIIAEINLATGDIISEVHELWAGSGGTFPEGPHLYKKDDYYYCLLAEGGTSLGHMVTMARSKDIFGPYVGAPNNPLFTHRDTPKPSIHATGHMDLVEDANGKWWAVFLGYRMLENPFHILGRETFLTPVTWAEGEFPLIGAGMKTDLIMDVEGLPAPVTPVCNDFTDDFTSAQLDVRYAFLRKASTVPYTVGNGLSLRGNGTDLDTLGTPSFIGFRQREYQCKTFCHLSADFQDASRGGLTVWYDNTRHFQIYLQNGAVVVEKVFDDFKCVVYTQAIDTNAVVLAITSDGYFYSFGYGNTEEEAEQNIVATGRTRHLATEASILSYTGVMFGVFADGGTESTFQISKIHYQDQSYST